MKTDDSCEDIIKNVRIAYLTMFEHNKLTIHFVHTDDQLSLIKELITNYVLFECQGSEIDILLSDPCLRVRFRFDND